MNDDDFDKAIQDALDANKSKLMNRYSSELGALQGLTADQLSKLIPATTRNETYQQLIAVVQQATQTNTQQAELNNKITALGQDAVKLAKFVGVFA